MVELKPKKSKTQADTIVRRSINRKQLFLLVLVSILIHALGLFLFVRYKPVEPIAEDRADLEPIDFTVIPEEIEAAEEAEVNNTPIEPEPTPPPVEPDPIPEAVTPPAPVAPTPVEPDPIPTPPPTSEAVTPPAPVAPTPVEPDPTPAPTPTPEAAPTTEPDPIAANSPPASPPPEAAPEESANPDGISTSASDLLGGDYEKTLASGGDAFFSPEALEYNSVLNPEQLKALKGIDLSKYLSGMESKVRPNWRPAFRQDDRRTVLTFNIEKDGRVTGLRVTQSSGSPEVDRESLDAIEKSAPFDPLPSDFPLDSLEITFSFNIHIY